MTHITPDEAEAMVALIGWLRNPWINAAPENERGPLPEWVYALMHEAADTIAALARLREADRAEVERLRELNYKYLWQVRDTCTRAETAEARLTALEADRVKVAETALRMAAEVADELADEVLRGHNQGDRASSRILAITHAAVLAAVDSACNRE